MMASRMVCFILESLGENRFGLLFPKGDISIVDRINWSNCDPVADGYVSPGLRTGGMERVVSEGAGF